MATDLDAEDALSTVKLLLQRTWPQLLARRFRTEDYIVVPFGCIHLIDLNPTEGLVWSTLSKNQVIDEVNFIKIEEIDALKVQTLFKVINKQYIHTYRQT